MTQPVYSQRLYAVAGLSPVGVVGPVVPDGVVWVLRDLDIVDRSTSFPSELAVYNQVGGLLAFVSRGASTESPGFAWRGRQIYASTERIGFQTLAGAWDIAASGYQLTLP